MKKSIQQFFHRLKGNKQMIIGLSLLTILIILAVFGEQLAPYDPKYLNDDLLAAPSSTYLLGTDNLGRDVLSMILYGIRTSLIIGFIAAMISAVIGVLVGGIAGYFGGILDKILNEIMNIFMMLPTFFLILLIVALFGSSMTNVMIVIGVTSWVSNARLMRAQAISIKERTFVKSAITMGESKWHILIHHVIPNGIFPIIAQTTMNISGAILTEASLSFLGLGDANVFSLGQIINTGKLVMPRCWWVSVFSGLSVVIIVLTFFLIGDGINRVLSPKMDANK
ncbi:ABC transporter permease [Traorella massiliensis]|uniref:ABC transporter permease n=1 Tax=Traorella massiliensis TaxID=1903263 RepID=UPI0008F85087|nr:ABC transporter permease [Traorella massiliensis]